MKELLRIFLKGLLSFGGFVVVCLVGLMIYFKVATNADTDSIMEQYMDSRLGIERCDYRVVRRNASFGALFQDPLAIQKIKISEQGWCKIEKYIQLQVDSYEIPLTSLGQEDKKLCPKVNYVIGELRLSQDRLSEDVELLWTKTTIDTEEEFSIINSARSGRFFVQDFWLGGHFAYLIIDTDKHIIYRKYGMI